MAKCENCKKYDDCRDGSGMTWPCMAYRPVVTTNADRIRSMSDEEMTEWLTEFSSEAFAAGVFKMAGPIMTKQERLDWLQQPAGCMR